MADTRSARSLHHLTVVTPEGVVLRFRAAGIASRTLAKMLDVTIQFTALFIGLILTGIVSAASTTLATIVLVVLAFAIFYGYPIILETWWNGRTIGKAALGIRVLTTEGGPVRLRHSAIRSMIATFDFFVPSPGGLLALAFALLTARSQRLGDLAAGTIVIRVPRVGQWPVYFPTTAETAGLAGVLDTGALTARQYALIRELMLRITEMRPEARYAMTEQVADRVAVAIGAVRPRGLGAEPFLLAVLNAHQARHWPDGVPPPVVHGVGPPLPGNRPGAAPPSHPPPPLGGPWRGAAPPVAPSGGPSGGPWGGPPGGPWGGAAPPVAPPSGPWGGPPGGPWGGAPPPVAPPSAPWPGPAGPIRGRQ